MIGSHRTCFAIILLTAAASMLSGPLAHANGLIHIPGSRSTAHSQGRFRLAKRPLPCNRQARPPQHVEDPLADMILG